MGLCAIKWFGGKQYLASRIVAMMPPHIHYVEPYAGGLAVLLCRNPEGVSEVVNDINKDLITFWTVLQNEFLFPEFVRSCEATPFSEEMYYRAVDGLNLFTDTVGRAWAFFVACRMSLSGRMQGFASLSRTRTRRGMNEQASAWLAAVEGLPEVHARLKRVVILNRDALDVIRSEDTPDTLFYLDPPYLHETRAAKQVYHHEMDEDAHRDLLLLLPRLKGKVILSGYPSALYDQYLRGWHRTDIDIANHAAGGTEKRRMTESLWTNYKIEE